MSWKQQLEGIRQLMRDIGRPVRLMEVCGTHTVAAFRSGLRSVLPEGLSLLSGPGCPVCVTPDGYIDHAIRIATREHTVLASFGDMLRVPGNTGSLEHSRATGARVRVVYSPADALAFARENPDTDVVFAGVGFETTAPAVAWTVAEAVRTGIANYSVLSAHKLMPPAMEALVAGGTLNVDGFLCPGHVSAVIGADAYRFLAHSYGIPCVVAGFEPGDLLAAVSMLLNQIAQRRSEVEIQYMRAVSREPNRAALELMNSVFEPCDTAWRGLGTIPQSGLQIRKTYAQADAETRVGPWPQTDSGHKRGCMCGNILRGSHTPDQCPLFANQCTPATPVGACMVSSEGTCAAYYNYAASPSTRTLRGPRNREARD
jgi:hydrogenase expression/formation protein HypD